jgi:hypothetical protein
MSFVRHAFRVGGALAAIFLLWVVLTAGAEADELADFHRAIEHAADEYGVAVQTLETRGREETAAAVHRFRAAWQAVIDRFEKNPPSVPAEGESYAAIFMQVDMRIVSALIVVDIGSREAARDALAPIAETLARLRERSAPPR